MPMIQSSYPPGSSLTQSDGGSGANQYLMALLGREDQALRQQQVQRAPVQGYQPGVRLGGGNDAFQALAQRPQMQERPFDMQAEHLKSAQMRDQLMQMQARQNPQPMKVTTVGNQTFYSPDTNAMNAYQREAYLPNNSQIVSNGTAVPTGSIEPVDGSQGARDFAASGGSGSVMTPSSASGSPLRRPLSPAEQAQQKTTNSQYQSGATWR